ncbi:hypothetical protein DRN98_08410 [Methanosarcinales archaeon]|nr:MAG: hypothetical protein DRN98_08410 [Methanosarcinales archaeon]
MKTLESLAQTVEDVNIPRGRKGGFVPKVIDRFKAFKTKIAKIVVEMFYLRHFYQENKENNKNYCRKWNIKD